MTVKQPYFSNDLKGLRRSLIAIGSPILLIASCNLLSPAAESNFSYEEEVRARHAVENKLKDPDSAQFSDMTKSKATGTIYGSVNAKNGFGGYTGYRKFEVRSDGSVAIAE